MEKVALVRIATFAGGTTDLLSGASGSIITVDSNGDGFEFLPQPRTVSPGHRAILGLSIRWLNLVIFQSPSTLTTSSCLTSLMVLLTALKSPMMLSNSFTLMTPLLQMVPCGRMLYWGTDENPAVLDIGSNGEILTVTNGIPAWRLLDQPTINIS